MTLPPGEKATNSTRVVNSPDDPVIVQIIQGAGPSSTGGLQEGTDIDGASMPIGGASGRGWLSAIWKLLSDRLTLGAKTQTNSLSFTPATDAIFTTQGSAFVSTTTITRAANTTPYTANDVFGAAFELTNISAANGNILLTSIDIIFNITSLPSGMGAFTLFLYSIAPPSAIADNGAFSLPSGDRASILTPIGISIGNAVLATGGGSVVLEADNLNLQFKPVSTSLFGYLVTNGAFSPAANSETAVVRARVLVV